MKNINAKKVVLAFLSAQLILCCLPFLPAALTNSLGVQTKAFALETTKLTLRPNGEGGSDVFGGTITRLTWEGQANPEEAIDQISLSLPGGTTFKTDNAKLTVLTGEKLMDRNVADATFSSDGETVTASLAEPTPAGSYLRIELYDVVFPESGGTFEIPGEYKLADGAQIAFATTPVTIVGKTGTEAISSSLENEEWVKQWNSNKFLRLFFNPPIFVSSLPLVFNGFLLAIGVVAVSFPCAIPFGLLLAIMRMAKSRERGNVASKVLASLARGISSTYINVVRGTPLFLQIYIAFFGLPLAGIVIPPFVLGVIVLAMNSAAYMCEIFRAGIQSIPRGQTEAARSLGMNGAQTMVFVIIPQTVRRVIPTLTSEFILLYKDTSMLAAVGVMEMVYDAKMIVANTGSITPYIVAALFYLVITIPLAKLVGNLERKLAKGGV